LVLLVEPGSGSGGAAFRCPKTGSASATGRISFELRLFLSKLRPVRF
jgi:hypothetical protein